MPKLTDREIRATKPAGKPYKRWDEGGLYLAILPSGSRSWRVRYALAGERQIMTLGLYPDLSLADARQRRNEIRGLLRKGRDPKAEQTTRRLLAALPNGRSFEAVARDWHERQLADWKPRVAATILRALERDAFPVLGKIHVADISPPMILALLRGIEARGAPTTAHEIRQRIGAVLEFATDTQLIEFNPVTRVRAKALTRVRHRKLPAIIDLPAFCAMMRKIETTFCYPATKAALRFTALVAARPNETCGAEWREFQDLERSSATWVIPPERMKTGEEHVVPLARAAADVVLAMRPLTHRCRHVFTHIRDTRRPLDLSTMAHQLVRLGFQDVHTAHGFRSSFSSIMSKRHPADSKTAIEAALAHTVPGTRGRYMRETFVERRRELAEEWAGLILDGAPDAEALLLGRRR
jgi:integrase